MTHQDKQTQPDPKAVAAWMERLGFTWMPFKMWRPPLNHPVERNLTYEEATFFYTAHHTALTSFRDEVLKAIGKDELKESLEGGICWACVRKKGCEHAIRDESRQEQRKTIKTISERHGI